MPGTYPEFSDAIERRTFEEEYLYGEATETIAALLESLSISQAELARRLGLTRGRVSQMLNGQENLTLRSLAGMAWALGVRFELQPEPMEDRTHTPADGDPPAPAWLSRLAPQPAMSYRSMPGRCTRTPWRSASFGVSRNGELRKAA